jgi:Ala-tRNA(Pro) deacylase
MSINRRLKDLLEARHLGYKVEEHDVAYTAQEVAAATHIKGKEMVKSVVLVADGKHMLCAVPASRRIDFEALKRLLGAKSVRLAEEKEFASDFPDCELGAMPPMGSLYEVPTLAAEPIKEDAEVAFNAGTHREVIRMRRSDWESLAKPRWGRFTRPAG